MTRQEAIELLVNATYSEEWQGNEQLAKAQHMAIDALGQEPSEEGISREWLVEEIARRDTTDGYVKTFGGREVIEIILNAPSVVPSKRSDEK